MVQILPTPVPVALLGATSALKNIVLTHASRVSRRSFIGALIAIATLFVAFLYVSEAFSTRVASAAPRSSAGIVYLGTSGAVAAPAPEKTQMLEMHIANNGLVLLRGAQVIQNSRGTIRVEMAWGGTDFAWIVETHSGTKFLTSEGTKLTIGDIDIGDIITVTGTLKESGAEPVLKANYIRK